MACVHFLLPFFTLLRASPSREMCEKAQMKHSIQCAMCMRYVDIDFRLFILFPIGSWSREPGEVSRIVRDVLGFYLYVVFAGFSWRCPRSGVRTSNNSKRYINLCSWRNLNLLTPLRLVNFDFDYFCTAKCTKYNQHHKYNMYGQTIVCEKKDNLFDKYA